MVDRIQDAEVKLLAAVSVELQADYADDDLQWSGSPFGWMKGRPSRQKGKIGECLVEGWLDEKGFSVRPSPDSDADRLVNGRRVEIKFSMLWKNGTYLFQQLRDQDYEFAVCMAVSPFAAHCWIIPKAEIMRRWAAEDGITSQHGGASGTDTAWLRVDPLEPAGWLASYGGSLEQAAEIASRVLG